MHNLSFPFDLGTKKQGEANGEEEGRIHPFFRASFKYSFKCCDCLVDNGYDGEGLGSCSVVRSIERSYLECLGNVDWEFSSNKS